MSSCCIFYNDFYIFQSLIATTDSLLLFRTARLDLLNQSLALHLDLALLAHLTNKVKHIKAVFNTYVPPPELISSFWHMTYLRPHRISLKSHCLLPHYCQLRREKFLTSSSSSVTKADVLNSLITTREGGGGPHDFFFNDHPHDCFKILIKIIYQGGGFELLDDNEGG